MTDSIKKLLVLCSGGDAPGMNAAIRSITRTARHNDIDVYGCRLGFSGLINKDIIPLKNKTVANIIQRGGTILKTARCPEFEQASVQQQCRDYLIQAGFDSLIVLGGNGSFQGARKLSETSDLNIIGIPCTIDNDIIGTDYCIGFDTACNTAINAIDNIRDTAFSHDRNFIIEVMGKNSGFLAWQVGISVGAELILTPENPISIDQICHQQMNKTREKLTSIIIAAEADKPGHSFELAANIKNHCQQDFKVCVLGHIQRGGSPSARDRTVATLMGAKAVQALQAGKSDCMIAEIENKIVSQPLPSSDHATRFLDDKTIQLINDIVSKT